MNAGTVLERAGANLASGDYGSDAGPPEVDIEDCYARAGDWSAHLIGAAKIHLS